MTPPKVDLDALLCALILAPQTFPRNRYFSLYDNAAGKRVRRRAARVRGIIRQLVGEGKQKAEITGETVLEDGRLLIRYEIQGLALHRTAALSALEAATFHYALHRAERGPLETAERRLVERTLERLGMEIVFGGRTARPKENEQ
ncbi:MAG TPA: hypothetical protein VF395_05215 [Polyangiaceae bacterium]